jgi:uncharacterized protein (DUF362 family)
MSKKTKDAKEATMARREFMKKVGRISALGAATGYVAFAPEDWPFSYRDFTGDRDIPQVELFNLKDFRVGKPENASDIGLGRQGTLGQKLRKSLDAIGGVKHYIKPGDIVLVKPNVAFDRSPILSATSQPEIIFELIKLLLVDCRAAEVRVTDNPIESPADCFEKTKIKAAVLAAGGRLFLPDSNAFQVLETPGATLIERWPFLARPFKSVNKVIGLSLVKDHNLCQASMSIKNWYGLLGGPRNQFHQRIDDIVSDLSLMLKPTFSILDCTTVLMSNGPTGGDLSNVKSGDTIICGLDAVAMDAYAYTKILERDDELPKYLRLAEEKGSGLMDYTGRIKEII